MLVTLFASLPFRHRLSALVGGWQRLLGWRAIRIGRSVTTCAARAPNGTPNTAARGSETFLPGW